MISLEGLLLCTGRHDEAHDLLRLFAEYERDGLIPNRFDDHGGDPHYNTADAALWFVHAAGRCASHRDHPLDPIVLDAIRSIVEHHERGSAGYGVRMDHDGLIIADDPDSALTWMDAKRGDQIFTPRHGKPVELSALWFNALHVAADLLAGSNGGFAVRALERADQVARSFNAVFPDEETGGCADVLVRDGDGWRPDRSIRPNQIFAASLPHSPLTLERQRGVVRCVRRALLTPFGLRTLAPSDPAYRGRYEGDLYQRDAAYHQGTVWPWLIGPYCDAVIRTSESTESAIDAVDAAIDPLRRELGGACLGQLAEVYDGDPPHRPSGCPAQAWSIAELLRIERRLDQLRARR